MIKGKDGTVTDCHCFLVDKGEDCDWGEIYNECFTFYLGWRCIDVWDFLFYYVSLYFEVFLKKEGTFVITNLATVIPVS